MKSVLTVGATLDHVFEDLTKHLPIKGRPKVWTGSHVAVVHICEDLHRAGLMVY